MLIHFRLIIVWDTGISRGCGNLSSDPGHCGLEFRVWVPHMSFSYPSQQNQASLRWKSDTDPLMVLHTKLVTGDCSLVLQHPHNEPPKRVSVDTPRYGEACFRLSLVLGTHTTQRPRAHYSRLGFESRLPRLRAPRTTKELIHSWPPHR